MANVWANSVACHPRASFHIAGCCHLANLMSWSQSYVSHCRAGEFNGMPSHSHVSHCRVLPLGEFTVMIPEPHATLQGTVTWRNQCHDRATLQGVIIPSAILKIVFRHILFFVFFNAVWALTSGSFRIVSDALVFVAVVWCPSVRPSVTFVYSVKTSNHILKRFLPLGSHIILVFRTKRYSYISTGTSLTRASNVCSNIWLHRVLSTVRPPSVIHTSALDRGKLMTLIADKWRRLLFAGDDDEVFMTRSFSVTPKNTEHNLIVLSGKTEATIAMYCTCTVEAN